MAQNRFEDALPPDHLAAVFSISTGELLTKQDIGSLGQHTDQMELTILPDELLLKCGVTVLEHARLKREVAILKGEHVERVAQACRRSIAPNGLHHRTNIVPRWDDNFA